MHQEDELLECLSPATSRTFRIEVSVPLAAPGRRVPEPRQVGRPPAAYSGSAAAPGSGCRFVCVPVDEVTPEISLILPDFDKLNVLL